MLTPSISLIRLIKSLHHLTLISNLKISPLSNLHRCYQGSLSKWWLATLVMSLLGSLFSLKSSPSPWDWNPRASPPSETTNLIDDAVATGPPPSLSLCVCLFFSFPLISIFSSPCLILCGFREWVCFGC